MSKANKTVQPCISKSTTKSELNEEGQSRSAEDKRCVLQAGQRGDEQIEESAPPATSQTNHRCHLAPLTAFLLLIRVVLQQAPISFFQVSDQLELLLLLLLSTERETLERFATPRQKQLLPLFQPTNTLSSNLEPAIPYNNLLLSRNKLIPQLDFSHGPKKLPPIPEPISLRSLLSVSSSLHSLTYIQAQVQNARRPVVRLS